MESKFKKKVSLQNIYPRFNSINYKIDCDCGSHDHSCSIDFEYDKDLNIIELNFFKDVCYDYWNEKDGIIYWIPKIWRRLTKAIRLVFTGNLEMNDSFLLMDTEHITNFIEALQEGLGYMEECKKKETDKFLGEKINIKIITEEKNEI